MGILAETNEKNEHREYEHKTNINDLASPPPKTPDDKPKQQTLITWTPEQDKSPVPHRDNNPDKY